jgi:hypothetical protein
VQLLASSLSWLWLAVQQPPLGGPEPTPDPTATTAVPSAAAPKSGAPKSGVIEMSPEWLPPTTPRLPQPVIGRVRVERMHLGAQRIDDSAITIDGHVDERAWQAVPVLPEMVQIEPRYGFAPNYRTEIRVAYGRKGIYVAYVCHGDPKKVRGGVFRKDQMGPSDLVWLELDPQNNDTNGYVFVTNPSGSQEDAQLFRDDSEEPLWDGVWQTAGKVTSTGWSSEIFVPWSTIRFEAKEEHTFGVNVGRWINDVGETHVLSPDAPGPARPDLVGPRLQAASRASSPASTSSCARSCRRASPPAGPTTASTSLDPVPAQRRLRREVRPARQPHPRRRRQPRLRPGRGRPRGAEPRPVRGVLPRAPHSSSSSRRRSSRPASSCSTRGASATTREPGPRRADDPQGRQRQRARPASWSSSTR